MREGGEGEIENKRQHKGLRRTRCDRLSATLSASHLSGWLSSFGVRFFPRQATITPVVLLMSVSVAGFVSCSLQSGIAAMSYIIKTFSRHHLLYLIQLYHYMIKSMNHNSLSCKQQI